MEVIYLCEIVKTHDQIMMRTNETVTPFNTDLLSFILQQLKETVENLKSFIAGERLWDNRIQAINSHLGNYSLLNPSSRR